MTIGVLLIAAALAAVLKPVSLAPYLLNGPQLIASPRDPGPWTTVFELLALGAGAVVLVGLLVAGSSQ